MVLKFEDFLNESKFFSDETLDAKFKTLSKNHFKYFVSTEDLIDKHNRESEYGGANYVDLDSNYIKDYEHSYNFVNGWYIKGTYHNDVYDFTDSFRAFHPLLGWVYTDYNHPQYPTKIYATSKRTFEEFEKSFEFSYKDKNDI